MKTNSKLPNYWKPFIASMFAIPALFLGAAYYFFQLPESELDMQIIILVGFYIAGASLLRRHENNWSFSLFVLMSILFGSAVQVLRAPSSLSYVVLIALQVGAAVAACAYVKMYFRYPYVDRRKAIFAKAQRKNVGLSVELLAHIHVPGVIENLSLTGARIQFDNEFDSSLKQIMFVDMKIPDLSGMQLKCRVMGVESAALRVKFVELSKWQRELIEKHLKSMGVSESAAELAS